MIELDVILQLVPSALFASFVAVFVFGSGRRGEASFRVFPRGSTEWVAYCLHTLEFALVCGTFAALYSAGHGLAAQPIVWNVWGCAVALIISAIAFWSIDRILCCQALIWLLFAGAFLFLLFPCLQTLRL